MAERVAREHWSVLNHYGAWLWPDPLQGFCDVVSDVGDGLACLRFSQCASESAAGDLDGVAARVDVLVPALCSVRLMNAPPVGSLWTVRVACWCSRRRFAMVRPSPAPPSELPAAGVPRMPGSKTCGRRSGSIPCPWSWTVISTRDSSAGAPLRWIGAPGGAVADCIVEDVGECAFEAVPGDDDAEGLVAVKVERVGSKAGRVLEAGWDFLEEVSDRYRRRLGRW